MTRHGTARAVCGIVAALALLAGCRAVTPSLPDQAAPVLPEAVLPLDGSQVADVQVALARTLESRGEVRQAARVYAEAVQKDPNRADAWARLAVLADKEGRFDESDEYHRRSLELAPNDANLHCNRGYSLYLQERWHEAETSLRNAIALKGDHRYAHNNLGLVLGRTGQEAKALVSFRNAGCTPTDAHTNLAYALTLNGDWAGARKQYELAIKLSPASDLVRERLKRINVLATGLGPTQEPANWNSVRPPANGVLPAVASHAGQTPSLPPTGDTMESRP